MNKKPYFAPFVETISVHLGNMLCVSMQETGDSVWNDSLNLLDGDFDFIF